MTGKRWITRSSPRLSRGFRCSWLCSTCRMWPGCFARMRRKSPAIRKPFPFRRKREKKRLRPLRGRGKKPKIRPPGTAIPRSRTSTPGLAWRRRRRVWNRTRNRDGDDEEKKPIPGNAGAERIEGPQHLPPLHELIEQGKVLALNMPAGSNPALARAVGVMLKNAWLQALLMRPAKMKESPGVYFRPAVFICNEYQAFASVGEDDPSGDEKSFALTRQCRCIPIVATQSISSLRSVLGSSEAWRLLLQTLRTRIFLSLSDDASARIASELCGQVAKIKGSYTISETSKRAEVSPLSGRAGSTSSLTICPWDTPIGERRKQAEYERREWTGTPETVSTGAGESSGRSRSQRDHD